jgi:hypothetical protein
MPSFHNQQQQPRRAAFKYQERSVEHLKERVERKTSRFDSVFKAGFDTWRPSDGYNTIRFLPPTWDNARHYGYTFWQHGWIGPDQGSYLCLTKMRGKPCPICDEARKAQMAGDDNEYYKLSAKERVLSWILDRESDEPNKPLLFHMSGTQDRDIASLCYSRKTDEPIWIDNPDIGFDVSFQKTGKGLLTKYIGHQIAREESPLSEDTRVQQAILNWVEDNPLPTTLQYYPAEYLNKALLGTTQAVVDDGAGDALLAAPATPARTRRADPYEEEEVTQEATADAEDDDYNYEGLTGGKPEPQPQRRQQQPRATLRTR